MSEKPRILIVEEIKATRDFLSPNLQEFELDEAWDGRTALRHVQETPPDLILLDVALPGIDGKSVLTILKSNLRTTHIPVILLTGEENFEDILSNLGKMADDLLPKPIPLDQLKAKIYHLLKHKEIHAELLQVPGTLLFLSQQFEQRLPLFSGHSARAANFANILGHTLLLPPDDIYQLKLAASLHHLGYIGIPDHILNKPGILTPDERKILQRHPIIAADACAPFSRLQRIARWLRQHHEAFDGSGYPDGLSGNAISMGGRILAIAHAYSSLTIDCPHRVGFSTPLAQEVLRQGAGKRWDPELVETFINIALKKLDETAQTGTAGVL